MIFPRTRLRPFCEADVAALREIEQSAYQRYLSLAGFEQFAATPALNPECFLKGKTTVAEYDGKRAGYVIVQPLDGMHYIASLVVADGKSGLGIGKLLLDWANRNAEAAGASGTCLTTFRAPLWNGPWYRRQGYSEMPADQIGPGLQAILARHSTFLDMAARITMWKPGASAG